MENKRKASIVVNFLLNVIYVIVALSSICVFNRNSKGFPSTFFITYHAGFLKRGFIGTCLYSISPSFGISPILLTNYFIIVFALLNIGLLFYALWKSKLDWFILFSSFFILNIYAYHIAFRLDLLMVPLFILQMWILKSKRISTSLKLIITSLLMCLGVLIHEVYFVIVAFTFLFIVFSFLKIKNPFIYILTFLPSGLLFVLFITLYKGNIDQVEIIIQSWRKFNISHEKLSYLKFLFGLKGPIYIWDNAAFIKTKYNYVGFLLNYIAVCTVFYFYLFYFFNLRTIKNTFFIFINFLLVLLLCFVATDFIRWYYLFFLLILFYFLFFEEKKYKEKDNIYLIFKFMILFLGLPMYGWTMTHYYWTMPVKYLIDLKHFFNG